MPGLFVVHLPGELVLLQELLRLLLPILRIPGFPLLQGSPLICPLLLPVVKLALVFPLYLLGATIFGGVPV